MGYLAQLNEAGEVERVIVCDSVPWAESNLGGTWIETQFDGSERARFAGLGYTYDAELDAFLPPQPAWNYEKDGSSKSWIFPEGDHFFIPVDPRLIEGLSRALYGLIVPGKSGLYAGIIYHPAGQGWPLLQLRSSDVIPISLAADPAPLVEILSAFVAGGGITEAELEGIVAGVQAAAGAEIRVSDFVPPSWAPYILTREQAIAAGYFEG